MKKQYSIKHLVKLGEYLLDLDDKEYEDYFDFCDALEIDPENLKGKKQQGHVYAIAMVGLGRKLGKP